MNRQIEDSDRILLSIKDAAHLLSICERTLWSLVREQRIPHLRIGRRLLFSRDTLSTWVMEQQARDSTRAATEAMI